MASQTQFLQQVLKPQFQRNLNPTSSVIRTSGNIGSSSSSSAPLIFRSSSPGVGSIQGMSVKSNDTAGSVPPVLQGMSAIMPYISSPGGGSRFLSQSRTSITGLVSGSQIPQEYSSLPPGSTPDWIKELDDVINNLPELPNTSPDLYPTSSADNTVFMPDTSRNGNFTSTSNEPVNDVDLANVLARLGQYGNVQNFDIGFTETGEPYIKNVTVNEENYGYEQYSTFGYDSPSSMAYAQASGFVSQTPGRLNTIWDYLYGYSTMSLAQAPALSLTKSYIYDYMRGYQRYNGTGYLYDGSPDDDVRNLVGVLSHIY